MSIVISYILHLRHDEKDDFLPVEKNHPDDFTVFKSVTSSFWYQLFLL